jgi:uncharacterized membrane protein YbhN (UPF0104 family)
MVLRRGGNDDPVRSLFDAIQAFADGFAGIRWAPLGLAVLCHLGRIVVRSRAWRNVIAAAYPHTRVRWRFVFGGYVAGLGANAILPGRSGDLLRLYIVKQRVEGATYPTLASTLLVDGLFDLAAASLIVCWALWAGLLPGTDVLPRLPAIDWLWLFREPRLALAVAAGLLLAGLLLGWYAAGHVRAFKQRVAQGFTILRTPALYLRRVVLWDASDWALRLTAIFFFLRAFGLPATVHNAFLYQVAGSLSTALPLTPSGIGTEQALLVYLFSGVSSTSSILSFSVGVKLVTITVNVALGTIAVVLLLRTLRWKRRVAAEEAARS